MRLERVPVGEVELPELAWAEGLRVSLPVELLHGRLTSDGRLRVDGALRRTVRERAEAALRQADTEFTRAEALSEGVAKGHRLQLARRRMGLERHEAEWYAARFDTEMATLPDKRANRSAYRAALQRMVGLLNRVTANLEALLAIAAEHPDEMDLEIQWTRLDLERVRGYQKALRAEFDALR